MLKNLPDGGFVNRMVEMDKLFRWLDQPVQLRVKSVIGPPGIGKSAILQRVRQQLTQRSPERIILWWNLVEFRPNDLKKLLDLWFAQLQKRGITLPPSTMVDSVEVLIGDLVDKLCNEHYTLAPVLLVDGFDESSEKDRREAEVYLARFLAEPCMRIVVVRRDEYGLTNPSLRWDEEVLSLGGLSASDGQEHLQKLLIQQGISLTTGQLLLGGYFWNHPRANEALLARAVKRHTNGHNPLLTANDLQACLCEDITLAKPMPLPVWETLIALSRLPDQWTDSDLRAQALTVTSFEINWLIEQGIVLQAGGPFRRVSEGLLELTRVFRALNGLQ
jgi:hypothetical protein